MTYIEDLLRKESGARLSNGNRWLVITLRQRTEYVVYERKYMSKTTTEVYRGNSEAEACKILAEG